MFGVKKTTWKTINAVSVATEAEVIAAPASGKKYVLLKAILSSDAAGVYDFQDGSTTTTRFVAILEASKNPVTLDFGEDGIEMGLDKNLTCDGPASSALTGMILVAEV